jgi:formylglycine-generating enzyme required for sulfatase activity
MMNGVDKMILDVHTHFTLPLLEWIDIPSGSVTLTDDSKQREIMPFKITKYPITNAQYEAFIQAEGYQNPVWWHKLAQIGGKPRASDWREPDSPKLEVCW